MWLFLLLLGFILWWTAGVGEIIEVLGRISVAVALKLKFSSDDILEILLVAILLSPRLLCIIFAVPSALRFFSRSRFCWQCRILRSMALISWVRSGALPLFAIT